jgi:AhpD family alkylhydroperoxidase
VTSEPSGAPGGAGPRVRIDRQHPWVYRAQIEVARAVRAAVADAGFDRRLVELVNIRISQLNGCAYCLHVHVRDAMAAGETSQRLAVLSAWRDTTLFTDTESAALTLAESLTLLPDARTQDLDYAEAARHLTDEQLSAVSWVVVTMNAFNRISILSRHRVRPEPTTPPEPGTSSNGGATATTTRKASS